MFSEMCILGMFLTNVKKKKKSPETVLHAHLLFHEIPLESEAKHWPYLEGL